jgi:hypothetical protein
MLLPLPPKLIAASKLPLLTVKICVEGGKLLDAVEWLPRIMTTRIPFPLDQETELRIVTDDPLHNILFTICARHARRLRV